MDSTYPFIQSLQINTIKHLSDINIPIHDEHKHHLIITGSNGSGKTSILEAIDGYLRKFLNNNISNIEDNIALHKKTIINIKRKLANVKSQNHEKIKHLQLSLLQSSEKLEESEKKLKDIKKIIPKIINSKEIFKLYPNKSFLYAFFNSHRNSKILSTDGIKNLELFNNNNAESQKNNLLSQYFLQFLVNKKNQIELLKEKNELEQADKIQTWFDNITQKFRIIFQHDELELDYDKDTFEFKICIPGKEAFGFTDNQLSDAYSSIIHIITEILLRMECVSHDCYDVPGIVLIDEIDIHLHINMQKIILPFLTSFFPNIQFIVTTHSPFVLTSLANTVAFDIDSKKRWENLDTISPYTIIEDYFDSKTHVNECDKANAEI